MSIERRISASRDLQVGGDSIRIDPNDPQFTYRGKTVAIKIRNIIWPVVVGCIKMPDGRWVGDRDLMGDIFGNDPPGGGDAVAYELDKHGGAEGFVREVLVPAINDWLSDVYPQEGLEVPALQRLFLATQELQFSASPSGVVSVKLDE